MATKVTDLTELATTADNGDFLHIIDTSDTTGGAAGTSKKVLISNLPSGGGGIEIVSTKVSIDNAAVLAMKYNDTPVTLKAAEAGKIIMPVS